MVVPLGVGRDDELAFPPLRGGREGLQLEVGGVGGAGFIPSPEGLVRPLGVGGGGGGG